MVVVEVLLVSDEEDFSADLVVAGNFGVGATTKALAVQQAVVVTSKSRRREGSIMVVVNEKDR